MDFDLMHDAELIRDLIDEDKLNVKRLAFASGLGTSAIYKMLTGERTVSTQVLNAAWRLTADTRVLGLVLGGSPYTVQVVRLDAAAMPAGDPHELLPRCTAALRKAADCCDLVGRIVADGEIDHEDDNMIDALERHHAECQKVFAEAVAAVLRARGPKGAPSNK